MVEQETEYFAFISYASQDQDRAYEIALHLEKKGCRCWIAPRDVRPGREYGEEIIRGINSSKCMVLVLTEDANASPMVRREVERAASKLVPIFPFRIKDILPSSSLEFFIGAHHWIDAFDGPLGPHINRLIPVVNGQQEVHSRQSRNLLKKKKVKFFHRHGIAVGVVMSTIGILGLLVAWQLLFSGGDGNFREKAVHAYEVQRALQRLGYYNGRITGASDTNTRFAIKSFQREYDLIADGLISEELLRSLRIAERNISGHSKHKNNEISDSDKIFAQTVFQSILDKILNKH
ncbi:MAG: TIR domain-containing protein [Gammaproteobacteria bacterium]|nr:TIR domain-containing protein [Gammaproteobacteria bacterium]